MADVSVSVENTFTRKWVGQPWLALANRIAPLRSWAGLEQRAPGLRLDWFRKGIGKFAVVLIYEDREDFDRSAGLLHHAGFQLDK